MIGGRVGAPAALPSGGSPGSPPKGGREEFKGGRPGRDAFAVAIGGVFTGCGAVGTEKSNVGITPIADEEDEEDEDEGRTAGPAVETSGTEKLMGTDHSSVVDLLLATKMSGISKVIGAAVCC